MTNRCDRRFNPVLLATLLCGGGFVFAQSPAPIDMRSELARFQDIEYRLSEAIINGAQVTFELDPLPSIAFHSGRVISGYAGMNEYFAKIRVEPDGRFSFDSPGVAITKLTGEPQRMESEATFLDALQKGRFIRLEGEGISIETEDRATRLKFIQEAVIRSLPELLNLELRLVRLIREGKEVVLPSNATVTLTFQEAGGISGRSAVNNYAGVFTATPDGKIAIQLTTATQMAGPPELMAFENAYFDALSQVNQIHLKPNDVILEGETVSIEFAARATR